MENENFKGYPTAELTGLNNHFFSKNRNKYFKNLNRMLTGLDNNSILVLQGGDEIPRYDTDVVDYHFQQDANFYYLSGVREPKFMAIIDLISEELVLYYDLNKDERDNIFMKIPTLKELEEKYSLPVFDVEDLYKDIKKRNPNKIYLLSGVNSDSGLNVRSAKLVFPADLEEFEKKVDYNSLIYEILAETRATKSEEEISLLRYINEISIEAHVEAWRLMKPELYERDIENAFFNYLREKYFVRIWAYPMICGCGTNSSTLHYQDNTKKLKDGDLMLIDMGIRFAGYTSDITSTVPVNGKFSERQAAIYNIVLKANRTVQENIRAGVYWPNMHILAERVILNGLIDCKILNKGFDIDHMLRDRVAYYFMPHGLGHLMGIEVHDVGGYLSFTPKRLQEPGLSSLRTARYLDANIVITVEPGIYFIPFLLEKALGEEKLRKYFNVDVVKSFYDFGGVRIEDDVVVTSDGCINLTENIPRKVEEIENIMRDKKY